jgi:hypothetical protein
MRDTFSYKRTVVSLLRTHDNFKCTFGCFAYIYCRQIFCCGTDFIINIGENIPIKAVGTNEM